MLLILILMHALQYHIPVVIQFGCLGLPRMPTGLKQWFDRYSRPSLRNSRGGGIPRGLAARELKTTAEQGSFEDPHVAEARHGEGKGCREVGTHAQLGRRVSRRGLSARLSKPVLWPVLRILSGILVVGEAP